MTAFLDSIPTPWVFVLTALLLILSAVAGHFAGRLGRRPDADKLPNSDVDVDVVLGAVFGLLGLLLAFTFGIAEDRFSKRRALTIEEANVIETAYLRATAVPGEPSERLRILLREYAQLRVQSPTPSTIRRAVEQSQELHTKLWKQARLIALANPESEAMALLLESINNVIEVHEARVATALYQRLPTVLLASLYALSVLSMIGLGYKGGVSGSRNLFFVAALAVAFSIVLLLIVDLERPWQGLFGVGRKPLEDVDKAIQQEF